MTPCTTTTWGCALNCEANTFPISMGTLQISEANYAELGINNMTAPLAPSSSMPTSAPAAATMPIVTTPTNAATTACAIPSPPKSNASIVGIGVGIPLGLAFAITTLLFLNERRKLLKIRRARSLVPSKEPAQLVYQGTDFAKLRYPQGYPPQLAYEQDYQRPCPGPLSGDTFREAGGSPEVGGIEIEKETFQELP
ncbi:hypothetical protein MMC17_006426 [Xylographa soralifera]|nr:hypothetical protein [Xylographa soralifera]